MNMYLLSIIGSILYFNLQELLSFTISQFDAVWTDGGIMNPVTRTNYMTAAFNYDNKIYIFGSYHNTRSLYIYDTTTKEFTDKGTSALHDECVGSSQYWTQIGNLAYFLSPSRYTNDWGKRIFVYDLSTLTNGIPNKIQTISITDAVQHGSDACLTSDPNNNNLLYMAGGSNPDSTEIRTRESRVFRIYNIGTQQWSTGPEMFHRKYNFPCAVVGDYLYAIGGANSYYGSQGRGWIKEIERIQITNILSNSWQIIQSYTLLYKTGKHRAVTSNELIIVIGGRKMEYGESENTIPATDAVQIIDTINDRITYNVGALADATYSTAVILVDNILYAFAGGTARKTYQYLKLQTISPTSDPTRSPSPAPTSQPSAPTSDPTRSPSPAPTNKPTLATTNPTTSNPTLSPTYVPTHDPTKAPSPVPSNQPTLMPTNNPTFAPTNKPSTSPTDNPIVSPTDSPTNNPSLIPTNIPSSTPTIVPSNNPTVSPTNIPSFIPSFNPTISPTNNPFKTPSINPTTSPTNNPSMSPTKTPTLNPSVIPTTTPSTLPTNNPTDIPTLNPSISPTNDPSINPSYNPSISPTLKPSRHPLAVGQTYDPTQIPSGSPISPSFNPTVSPTPQTLRTTKKNASGADNKSTTDNNGRKGFTSSIIILIVLILVFVFLFVIFLILWLRKKREMQTMMDSNYNNKKNNDMNYIQLTDDDDNNHL